MEYLSIALIGLATNLDNFCMAMTLGIQKKHVSRPANAMISVISGAVSYVASLAAAFFRAFAWAGCMGGLLIAGVGVWTIYTAFTHQESADAFAPLNLRRTLIMGCMLALNCIPVTLGAGATGLDPLLLSMSVTLFSFLSMELGRMAGYRVGRSVRGTLINALSGVILVVLGCASLFG